MPVVENEDGTKGHIPGVEYDRDTEKKKRVAILHCKAGKGRSGTVACSYLISVRGWSVENALSRFTERRMKPGWGEGISIKSQRRWIGYVDRWAKEKKYTERKVKIIEVRVWGRRENVRLLIRGFVDNGKKIKVLHTWYDNEGEPLTIEENKPAVGEDLVLSPDQMNESKNPQNGSPSSRPPTDYMSHKSNSTSPSSGASSPKSSSSAKVPATLSNPAPSTLTILRPQEPIIVGTQDVNIEVERRNRTNYELLSVVTSTAHSWFNAYFEGRGPERNGDPERTGTYTVEWAAMDGLKGSSKRGVRAVEKIAVVWEILEDDVAVKEEEIAEAKKLERKQSLSAAETEKEDKEEATVKENIVEGDAAVDSDTEEGIQTYGMKGERV